MVDEAEHRQAFFPRIFWLSPVGIIPPLLSSNIPPVCHFLSFKGPLKIFEFFPRKTLSRFYIILRKGVIISLKWRHLCWIQRISSGVWQKLTFEVLCLVALSGGGEFRYFVRIPPPPHIVTAWLLKLKGIRSFETSRINNLLFSVNLQRLVMATSNCWKYPFLKYLLHEIGAWKGARRYSGIYTSHLNHASNVSEYVTTHACDHYRLEGPGIDSQWGRDTPQPSRLALGATQPPIRWIPGHSRSWSGRGLTSTTHPHLSPSLKKE